MKIFYQYLDINIYIFFIIFSCVDLVKIKPTLGPTFGGEWSDSDLKNVINPNIDHPFTRLSSGDIKILQLLYPSGSLSASMINEPVNAHSIVLRWSTSNPNYLNAQGPDLCQLRINSQPTVMEDPSFFEKHVKNGWGTRWGFPEANVYLRSHAVIDEGTIYSSV